jgi:hypothetical protein
LGSRDAVDLVYAEVNRDEIPRFVPKGSGRFGYFFAEVSIPSEVLFFDVLMHRDLYPGVEPELFIYDTAFEGIASVNDRRRDIDRLDMAEAVEGLGQGLARLRSADVPRYAELVEHAAAKAGFELAAMRGYRCRVDYPLYGSQVTLAFRAQER